MDQQALNRRNFLRQGALWVAGAALVEPVAKKLWAFPTNPLGVPGRLSIPQRPEYPIYTGIGDIHIRYYSGILKPAEWSVDGTTWYPLENQTGPYDGLALVKIPIANLQWSKTPA